MSRKRQYGKQLDVDPVAEKLPLQVTSISPQKKRQDRFSLFHEKQFLLGVSAQTLTNFSIKKGTLLTDKLYHSLLKAEEFQKVKDRAYLLLSGRDHSSSELKQKLRRKGFVKEQVDEVVNSFREKGLIKDDQFAKKFAADKTELRQWGPVKVQQALMKKGVSKKAASTAIEEATENLDQVQICVDLAMKKSSRFERESDPYKRKQKIYRYLAGKGYYSETVKKALPEILEKLDA